jgi:hypothetical protein
MKWHILVFTHIAEMHHSIKFYLMTCFEKRERKEGISGSAGDNYGN